MARASAAFAAFFHNGRVSGIVFSGFPAAFDVVPSVVSWVGEAYQYLTGHYFVFSLFDVF